MHRFRGNIWDYDSKPQVMQALRYPLSLPDRIPEITEARNIELGLGLQVFSLTSYQLVIFRNLLTYCLVWRLFVKMQWNLDIFFWVFFLWIQLSFLHPSKYKFEHPRFCYERLEYVGQKIQVHLSCNCINLLFAPFITIILPPKSNLIFIFMP